MDEKDLYRNIRSAIRTPEKLIEKENEKKRVEFNKNYKFECNYCGKCCEFTIFIRVTDIVYFLEQRLNYILPMIAFIPDPFIETQNKTFIFLQKQEFHRYAEEMGYSKSYIHFTETLNPSLKKMLENNKSCVFYNSINKRCLIYHARPLICRTYPFSISSKYIYENFPDKESYKVLCDGICFKKGKIVKNSDVLDWLNKESSDNAGWNDFLYNSITNSQYSPNERDWEISNFLSSIVNNFTVFGKLEY